MCTEVIKFYGLRTKSKTKIFRLKFYVTDFIDKLIEKLKILKFNFRFKTIEVLEP